MLYPPRVTVAVRSCSLNLATARASDVSTADDEDDDFGRFFQHLA